MKYNQVFTLNKHPLKYVEIEEFETPKNYYGFMFLNSYGEKLLTPAIISMLDNEGKISNESLQTLGMIITNKFFPIWRNIFNTLKIEYNPVADYRITGTEKITSSNKSENSDTREVKNYISGFNSDISESIDDSNSNSAGSSNRIGEGNSDKIYTKEGITGSTPIQDYINREIELRKLTISDIITKNVIDFITLAIY